MVNLDYCSIRRRAENREISPQLYIKEILNYRKCKANENDCKVCKNVHFMSYVGYKAKLQCVVITEDASNDADVDYDYTCDGWESVNN